MTFNPQRLEVARKRRGITKTVLAERADISTRMLTAIERFEKSPGTLTIQRLAKAVGFPISFLEGDDLEELSAEGASFRSLSSLTARQRDQALGLGALAISLSEWIEARFDLPKANLPEIRGSASELVADLVRQEWGLGIEPIGNMIHILEAHGVRVFSLAVDRKVGAFSEWQGDTPYVFLNTGKSAEKSRFDAAHELGHLVMHVKGGPGGRQAEHEADKFASAFLMPAKSVQGNAPRGISLNEINQAKTKWKVAAVALAYRMHMEDVGLLSEWQYRQVFTQMSKRGWRTEEPDPRLDPERSQVLAKVFRAMREEGVGRPEIARSLSIPLEDLDAVIFGLAMTSIQGEGNKASEPGRPELLLISSPTEPQRPA